MRIGIIGAGICGLAAARGLRAAGHEVTLLDKGRGPGGRTSSRRSPVGSFDHGAPYFTAQDPIFRSEVQRWLEEGVAARWDGRFVELRQGEPLPLAGPVERFVGAPRMSAIGRRLAQGLRLEQRRVTRLEPGRQGWHLRAEDGSRSGPQDWIVLTAPTAQAAALLPEDSDLLPELEQRELRPCWAALVAFEEPLALPFDGASCRDPVLDWVGRETSKPGRGSAERWVLHSSAAWAEAHLGAAPALVLEQLVGRLFSLTGHPHRPLLVADSMFWRYAQPTRRERSAPACDHQRRVLVAGDGFGGGRVEGAYLSGRSAAALVDPRCG